ncbi:hypothetical protein BaRGS_00030614, partial [Batillaria attramentaria]
MSAPLPISVINIELRKLRKKLRQIENLERLNRPLDALEEEKVLKKFDIRERLRFMLIQQERAGAGEPECDTKYEPSAESNISSTSVDSEEAESGSRGVESDDVSSSDVDILHLQKRCGNEGHGDRKSPVQDDKPKQTEDAEVAKEKQTEPPKRKTGTDPQAQSLKRERIKWSTATVEVSELPGHSDIITAVCVQNSILVTGSRDTTVKVWDVQDGRELRNLGGHVEAVTCLTILPPSEVAALRELKGESLKLNEDDSIIISGSADSTFRLWSLKTGKFLKSWYTYNYITCLDYSYTSHLLVTSSDGGKLDLWNLQTSEKISMRAYEEAVTGLKVSGDILYSASADGLMMVHKICDKMLVPLFVSEDIKLAAGDGMVMRRPIRSLEVSQQTIIYGEDAVNLKLLDWRTGLVRKLANHTTGFAYTDALCLYDNLLFSTSYDLDKGTGYVNVRQWPSGEYLASLNDEFTERILCIGCTQLSSGNLLVVCGGTQLMSYEVIFPGK